MSYKPKPSYIRGGRVYKTSRHGAYRRGKKKDFAWIGRRKNPMNEPPPQSSIRIKLYVLLFIGSVFGMGWMLLYHSFFQISTITIAGNDRVSDTDIRETVYAALDYKHWFLFPAKSFLFADTKEVESILNERFPLTTVHVEKHFPSTLNVTVEERLSTLIYDNGDTYYFIGLTGNIVEPIQKVTPTEWKITTKTVTSTNDLGEEIQESVETSRTHKPDTQALFQTAGRQFPLIISLEESIPSSTIAVNTLVVQPEHIKELTTWYEALPHRFSIPFRYADMSSPFNTAIYTNGPTIYVSLMPGESGPQMSRLETVLKETPDVQGISYIDVRFPDRVYWK